MTISKNLFSKAFFGAAILTVSSFGFTACNNDTTSTPTTPSSTKPGVGSQFISQTIELDSTGSPVIGSESYDTTRVIQTGLTVNGKTNALEMFDSYNDGSMDTVYLRYEDNGDVSTLSPGDNGWTTYPFGSKQTSTRTVDTNFDGMPVTMTEKIEYNGTETLTIAGKSLSAQKLKLTLTSANPALPINATQNVWYVPSIGMIAKTQEMYQIDLGMFSSSGGDIRTLQSYNLK